MIIHVKFYVHVVIVMTCTLKSNFFLFLFSSQLKRLKLRKNNWDTDTYEFDEVLTESASQKRVYEVVAKPVVEVCFSSFLFTSKCQSQSCLIYFLHCW